MSALKRRRSTRPVVERRARSNAQLVRCSTLEKAFSNGRV